MVCTTKTLPGDQIYDCDFTVLNAADKISCDELDYHVMNHLFKFVNGSPQGDNNHYTFSVPYLTCFLRSLLACFSLRKASSASLSFVRNLSSSLARSWLLLLSWVDISASADSLRPRAASRREVCCFSAW